MSNPPFVVINYSQDLSTESYLDRTQAGKPKGIGDRPYKVYTVVNIPGSVEMDVISEDGSTVREGLESLSSYSTNQTFFADFIGHKDVFIHDDMLHNGDNDVILITPAGKPVQLPKSIIPSFTGAIKGQKNGQVYDLGLPRGVLLAYKDGGQTYKATFNKVDGEYKFKGYKLHGGSSEDCIEMTAPAGSESMVVIGAEDKYCFLGIYSGYYSHGQYNSASIYYGEGTILTSPIQLREKVTQGWIRIDNGCVRDIELATFEPSYMDILKNGFFIVNPNDPNGVMFSYQVDVEGYEAGDGKATGYIYRYNESDGGEVYFKWNGTVWERFVLSKDEVLAQKPDLLTVQEIWEAFKNDPVHGTLDLAGFVPVIGMAADGLNAVIYLVEGNKVAAALSSIAIVSSGVAVGVKMVVKVTKASKTVKTVLKLSDDFAGSMEEVIKTAKQGYIGTSESWYALQNGVVEIAAKYGDEGKRILVELSKMENKVDFLKLTNKINDLENSADFVAALGKADFSKYIAEAGEGGVDAWAVLKKTEIDGLSGKVDNLESLNKALKQDGYDADYFETLLKSKDNPQKFLDDYVSKIGDNGKFADDALETDYTSYLSRKAREGKPPRDRADWNHTRDYMLNDSPLARGNNFNRKAWENEWYPAWEVQLDNGKFIDGYNPFTKEIVSRKATDLVDINESTLRGYLDELVSKYAPPRKITTKKQGAIYDQLRANPDLPLDSKLVLEIPESNRTFFDIDRYTQIASEKGITIKFAPE